MNLRSPRLLCAAALLAGFSACHRQVVTVYMAPKDAADAPEESPAATAVGTNAPMPAKPAELPKLVWKLPAGWKDTGPGQTNAASFSIEAEGGQAAVAITPLPDMSGKEAIIVNMWRQQAGLPDLEPAPAEAALSPIAMSAGTGKFFEISSEREGKPRRIVTAMLNRGAHTWFFKLQGDAAVVEAQKPAFLDFLKTIQFEEKAVAAVTEPPPAPEIFQAPEGWRRRPPKQMQVARYAMPEQGDAEAEVSVSVFPSDTGGPVANIVRWRRQIGMPDLPESEVGPLIKPLEGVEEGVDAVFTDLQQAKQRLIGAIVHRGDKWWFFKLMGDEAAVAAARESFLNFAKSPPKS